jgi:betaine lipid synthase
MDDHMPISSFDAIYLIDLCEPLLEVARRRFAAKGWKNVHCLHQDASKFVLPEWQDGEIPTKGEVSLVTMSYSLSMVCHMMSIDPLLQILITLEQIPTFHQTLDRIERVLHSEHGMIGVVDFYAGRETEFYTGGDKVCHSSLVA